MRYLLLCILLAGCGSLPEKPESPPAVMTVDRPVTVYEKCPAKMPMEPKWCNAAPEASDEEWLRCELADANLMRGYILELKTSLAVCVD